MVYTCCTDFTRKANLVATGGGGFLIRQASFGDLVEVFLLKNAECSALIQFQSWKPFFKLAL